jgi:hypothetical protein
MKQLEDNMTLDMHDPVQEATPGNKVYAARKAAGYVSIALAADAVEAMDAVRAQLVIRKGLRLTKSQTVGYVMYEYRRMLEAAK